MLDKIHTINADGVMWYHCGDVGKVIGLKRIRDSLVNFPTDLIVNAETLLPHSPVKCRNWQPRAKYVNRCGILRLLTGSVKPKAVDLAKELGVDVHTRKYETKESESIGAIMKAFDGQKMRQQYPVKGYRVDLYFPDYDLCIECDENNHNDRDEDYEKTRQRRITKRIKCQWLRFDPDSDDFNIFKVINQIFIIINSK